MATDAFSKKLLDEGVDPEQLYRLLDLIYVPAERTGLSFALPNLLASAQALSRLVPDSNRITGLVELLNNANKYLHLLDVNPIDVDFNPLHGRYEEYPVYSLFTQQAKLGEHQQLTNAFHLAAGLVLTLIWLADSPWSSLSYGYGEYIHALRKIRRHEKWDEFPTDISIVDTLGDLAGRLDHYPKNSIAAKVRSLAIKVLNKLSGSELDQAKVKQDKHATTRSVDFGDHDVWKVGNKMRARVVATARAPTPPIRTLILKESPPQREGVDSSDEGVVAKIAQAPAESSEDEKQDLNLQIGLVLGARFATEFDNQLLPYKWEDLNDFEISNLVKAIKSALSDTSAAASLRLGALISGLSIVTSRSPEKLGVFRFFLQRPDEPLLEPCIILDESCWYSPFPPIERFNPTLEQAEWLLPVGEGCFLPLPFEFLPLLRERCIAGDTLSVALGCSPVELDKYTSEFCSTVRREARSRVNVSWLRTVMFHRMFALSKDDVGSVATLGNTELAPSIGLYYATFDPNHWREVYGGAITSLDLTESTMGNEASTPYGSRQLPDQLKLQTWIAEFGKSAALNCKLAKVIADFRNAHNLFACYSFLMTVAATCHRPAALYTFSPSAIDLINRWAINSDKITSPTTRVRLVPLADLVINQLRRYDTHLHNLSARLFPEYEELSALISMLVDEPRHILMPYFFWLNDDFSTTPIDIDMIIKRFDWPYEGKALKHFMATGLRNEGISAEHIAILLAHIEAGQYGFGKFSALSPSMWQSIITPAIERVMVAQGWINIDGIPHSRKQLPDHRQKRLELSQRNEFEFFAKAKAHVESSKSDRAVVHTAFKAAKRSTAFDAPTDVFLAAFRDEIIRASQDAPDRLANRLNIHVRYVRLHRHLLRPSSIPGWNADTHVEDTPLLPDTLRLAKQASAIRDAIPPFASKFPELNNDDRILLIVISSILYGGLLQKNILEQLCNQLTGGIRRFNGYIWIDFDDPQSKGCQRWFPDPATSLLIGRYLSAAGASSSQNPKKLFKGIAKSISQLLPTTQPHEKIASLDDLLEVGKAFFMLRIPGILRSYACGEVRSASLMESAWLRILTGRPVIVDHPDTAKERQSIRTYRHKTQSEILSAQFLKKLRNAIRDEFPPSSSGATNRKGERKSRLASLSLSLSKLASKNPEVPSLLTALLLWTDHLATEGSVIAKKPEATTIYSYVSDIARALIKYCANVDFLELSDAELIDIYQRVLDCGSKKNQASRAQSLRWFHEFCEEEFDLQDVDWGEVAPGLTTDKSSVSANLVTFAEYSNAKELLRNHPTLTKRERQMHEVGLILIYRCGLRLGELLRLTVSDLVLEIKNVLLVRNGIYGKTKTRAGIRQIPWLQNLDESELKLLKDWLDHRASKFKNDPWVALFGTEEEGRLLEVRLRISRVITTVLRIVTGEPASRIHHLRHGAATNAITVALSSNKDSRLTRNAIDWLNSNDDFFNAEFGKLHLGQSEPTRRIIWAISQSLGHSSPRTTIWHYGHSLDVMLFEQVCGLTQLRNVQISQLSGMPQNSLNVASSRQPAVDPATIAINWLYKDVKNLSPGTQLSVESVSVESLSKDPVIIWITSPKLLHSILTDLSNGFRPLQIAVRYMREQIEIETIEASGISIERKTGYRQFHLAKVEAINTSDDTKVDRQHNLRGYISTHAAPLAENLRKAFETEKSRSVIERGTAIWVETFRRSQSGLRLSDPRDLDTVIDLLKEVEIDIKQIVLASNSEDILDHFSRLSKHKIPKQNCLKRSPSYRASRRTQSATSKTVTLLFTADATTEEPHRSLTPKSGKSLSMKKLNHLLFLCSIIIRSRKSFERNELS